LGASPPSRNIVWMGLKRCRVPLWGSIALQRDPEREEPCRWWPAGQARRDALRRDVVQGAQLVVRPPTCPSSAPAARSFGVLPSHHPVTGRVGMAGSPSKTRSCSGERVAVKLVAALRDGLGLRGPASPLPPRGRRGPSPTSGSLQAGPPHGTVAATAGRGASRGSPRSLSAFRARSPRLAGAGHVDRLGAGASGGSGTATTTARRRAISGASLPHLLAPPARQTAGHGGRAGLEGLAAHLRDHLRVGIIAQDAV